MVDDTDASLRLVERVVLLGVTRLAAAEETPAHTAAVVSACRDLTADVDADVLGTVSEPEVSRALGSLEDADLVRQVDVDDPSPVGKGRPVFELSTEREAALSTVRTDDRLTAAAERVAD